MALRLLDQFDYLLCIVQLGVIAEGLAHHELLFVLHIDRVALLHNVCHLLLLAVVRATSMVVALEIVDQLDLVGGEDLVGLALLCLLAALVRFGNFLNNFLSLFMLPPRALSLLLALIPRLGRGHLLLLLYFLLMLMLLLPDLLVDDALDLTGCLGVLGR